MCETHPEQQPAGVPDRGRIRAVVTAVVAFVVTALLAATLAGCSAPPGSDAPTGSPAATGAANPARSGEPAATSPATPAAGSSGLAGASQTTVWTDYPGTVPTATPAPPATGTGGQDAFCSRLLATGTALAGSGLTALKSLAVNGGSQPQIRALVQAAVTQTAALAARAPAELRAAAATLASAWSRLATELSRQGYDRGELAVLAVKFLGGPAVAVAWDLLSGYANAHCGVTLPR